MAEHCALIVDEDESFRARLARLLDLAGIELIHTSGEEDLLSLLECRRPVVVVLAVDLPEKEGFFLFSEVKRVQRTVPVVITTSTVSRADLKMHEKLSVHAELYIEKTELSDTDLFDAVAGVAGQERALADVTEVGDAEDEPEEVAATSQDAEPVEELASSRAELERLNAESEKVRALHEQEIKELTARLATAEKECHEQRDEASKLDGQIGELHERLERLNEGDERSQERREQETIKFENTLSEERKQAAATRQDPRSPSSQ